MQKITPYNHQLITTDFFLQNLKCFCWNEAGTGKTACAIWALIILLQEKKVQRILITCPLSTVRSVWDREIFKILPSLRPVLLLGTKAKRCALLKSHDTQVAIVNHDGVKVIEQELAQWKPDLVVIDESTCVKSWKSERFKTFRRLCKNVERVWLLSGTPMPQSPLDMYSQGQLVCPEAVGKSMYAFRAQVMYQVSQYQWLPREGWQEFIARICTPNIRFARKDCLDLPPVTYTDLELEFSTRQAHVFKTLKRDMIVELTNNAAVTAVHEGVLRNKLLQVCCGWVYGQSDNTVHIECLEPKYRLEELLSIVEECSQGVLVFVPYISAISEIHRFLLSNKIASAKIFGETSMDLRTEYFDKFQNDEIKVLIAHPKTMGHGVTLTNADTVVWFCVTSDNELYEQANARINRIGQVNKMRVIHFYTTNFEQKILTRLRAKQSMQGLLLDYVKQGEV